MHSCLFHFLLVFHVYVLLLKLCVLLTAEFKIYEDAYVHGGRWLRDIKDMDTCMYACINMGGDCGAADWDPATQVCYVHEEKTTKKQLIRKDGVKHGVKCEIASKKYK